MHGQRRVRRKRPVVVSAVDRVLADHDAAHLRPGQDVAAVAADEEVLPGAAERGLCRDVHRSDVVASGLARQPGPAHDRDRLAGVRQPDPPREEEVGEAPEPAAAGADAEHAGVLEKEVPLLRKEEGEAGQVDLLLVHLHLREIGVQGEVQVQGRKPRRT